MRWIWILAVAPALAQTAPAKPPDAMRAAIEKQQAAAARQRESIRKQAENLGVWLPPGTEEATPPATPTAPAPAPATAGAQAPATAGAGPEMPCDLIEDAAVAPIIEAAAKAQSLQAKLLRAVIEQESRYRPCAVSPKGAKGLMQLMPDTADQFGVKDPFDPKQNIEAGARYLKQLLDRYSGDLPQALGAYNAGPGTVDQAGGVPKIRETTDYVNSIMQKMGGPDVPPGKPPPE